MWIFTRDIDYGNFKSEVARHQGSAGAAYEDTLHEVWGRCSDCSNEGLQGVASALTYHLRYVGSEVCGRFTKQDPPHDRLTLCR